mgnify:CR=1 FL=1
MTITLQFRATPQFVGLFDDSPVFFHLAKRRQQFLGTARPTMVHVERIGIRTIRMFDTVPRERQGLQPLVRNLTITFFAATEGAVIKALERNSRYIRGVVARAVNLKFAPQVRFREDETFEEASRIDALLASPRVRQDTEKKD